MDIHGHVWLMTVLWCVSFVVKAALLCKFPLVGCALHFWTFLIKVIRGFSILIKKYVYIIKQGCLRTAPAVLTHVDVVLLDDFQDIS